MSDGGEAVSTKGFVNDEACALLDLGWCERARRVVGVRTLADGARQSRHDKNDKRPP